MIANEYAQHYAKIPGISGKDTLDFANDMEIDHDYDVLPSIASENAILKIKLKQECDIAHVNKSNISKAEIRIEALKRDISHCDVLIDSKSNELDRLEEELNNLCVSREHIKCNAENLKRQHELITIEDEQRKKEEDSVRANYEKMIRNKKEIFNSNRLVVRRNNLQNQCEGTRIQSAVLEERLQELHRQRRQFREIQNLHLRSVSIELAQEWLNNKKGKEHITELKTQLREKQDSYDKILSQKNKAESNTRSPGSRFVSLPMPTFSQALHIPSLNAEETELTKYFRKINVFKKSRSPCLLPNVLSRATSSIEKESYCAKICSKLSTNRSPMKKNPTELVKNINENESKTPETPKLNLEEASKTSAFQPVNSAKLLAKETAEIQLQVSGSSVNLEKRRQTPTSIDNHTPSSPAKVISSKFKPVEKHASPLTVSRMSPLNTPANKSPMRNTRIPVPISTSSPIHVNSRIPVRFSPITLNQKRDYVEKETISRRFDNLKKIERSSPLAIQIDTGDVGKKSQAFKRTDVGSPRREIKIPRMDYGYTNTNRNSSRNAFDSNEIPTIEVEEEPSTNENYLKEELNVDTLIGEVNNKNNPMIKSHLERMRMLREEYTANEMDDIELIKKSSQEPKRVEYMARESLKTDNRLLSRNLPKGVSNTDKIPTIEVDEIENDIDDNNATVKSYVEQIKTVRERPVGTRVKWSDRHQTDDIEMLKKLAKDSTAAETGVRDPYKLDARYSIKDQTGGSNRYNPEFAKHYEKSQTNLYRREPKDFRAIGKGELEMNSKNFNSRFEKLQENVEKLSDEGGRAQNKYNDMSYSSNNELSDSPEKLSKASSSSFERNRLETVSPFGVFTSPPSDQNTRSSPFGGAFGESGSIFSFGSSVNQLFGLSSTDGTSGQNQNNGFLNFGGSMERNNRPMSPMKMF